jgi:thiol:disulfide interchange protein DsbD
MIDATNAGIRVVQGHDPAALPLLAVAGLVTSIGPCVAPRYVAMSSLWAADSRRGSRTGAFVAGLLVAYGTLAGGVGVLGFAWANTPTINMLFSAALGATGAWIILREPGPCSCSSRKRTRAGLGGAFALGFGSAFVISPCCTPIIVVIGTIIGTPDGVGFGILCVVVFGLSHAAPLVLSAAVGRFLPRCFRAPSIASSMPLVSGTLLLALSAYYGFLI